MIYLHWLPVRQRIDLLQNCYYYIHGVALPTAFLPRWITSKIHPFTIASNFCCNYFLFTFEETFDGIFKIIFLSCIQHIWYKFLGHLPSVSTLPRLLEFRKHLKRHAPLQAYHGSVTPATSAVLTSNIIPSTIHITRSNSAPRINSFVQFLFETCYILAHVQRLRNLLTY